MSTVCSRPASAVKPLFKFPCSLNGVTVGNDASVTYDCSFLDENFSIPHNKRGVLGMVNKGHHTNASQFYVTLQAAPYLDKKYVAFGYVHDRFSCIVFTHIKCCMIIVYSLISQK